MRLFPAFFEDSFLGSVFHALVLKVPLTALLRGTSLRGGGLLGVVCLPAWCGAVQGLTDAYWSGKRRRRGSGRNGASGNAIAGCGLACRPLSGCKSRLLALQPCRIKALADCRVNLRSGTEGDVIERLGPLASLMNAVCPETFSWDVVTSHSATCVLALC